jgi:hypothetical protein
VGEGEVKFYLDDDTDFERSDDISTVAYWYQATGENSLVSLPPRAYRRPR